MKRFAAYLVVLWSAGCQQSQPANAPLKSRPVVLAADPQLEPTQRGRPRESIERTTAEGDLVFTVSVPRASIMSAPVEVTTELSNHGTRPVRLTYSRPVRAVWPEVWLGPSGKLPLTPEGKRVLGSREEFSNITYEIAPGRSWKLTFNIADYYQMPGGDWPYTLAIHCAPEWFDPTAGQWIGTTFDVSGIRFRATKRDGEK